MSNLVNFVIALERTDLEQEFGKSDDYFTVESVAPLSVSARGGLDPANFIEPVSVIVAATLASLAYRLVEHCLRQREQGVQIDARTSPATVSTIAGVPAGFVVLIASDGSVTTQQAGTLTSAGLATLIGSILPKTK